MNINDIALSLEDGVGALTAAALLEEFGSAEAIYAASPSELTRAGLREGLALQIARKEAHRRAAAELKYIDKHGITAVASTDEDYPPLMREAADHPHVLYVCGDVNALTLRCVSIVGTRQFDTYGDVMCDRLVKGLAERVPGLCIVSGLAFGVDMSSHRAALRHGVPTIAVIPNALPNPVPASNAGIVREIVARGGAVVTELHSNSKQKGNFYIPRNRLIAALSEGTVVVQSDLGGGAMTTADFAFGYNRLVMAVPGRATDKTAKGPNWLIKSNKAQMVCNGEDVIRTLGWDLTVESVGPRVTPAVEAGFGAEAGAISVDAAGLLGCFRGGDAVSVDLLSELSALNHSELAPILLELEFAGKITRLPGGLYERIA